MDNAPEQIPVEVMNRMLGGSTAVRVALAVHPVTQETAPCVPVIDYAEAFSYESETLLKMIRRTPWLQRHSTPAIMSGVDGKMRAHTCMFEEAALGVFMKLQPSRCKDAGVAVRIDELQEELIGLLRDALRGHTKARGYQYPEPGRLPQPGLTMDAISTLARTADKHLRGKASLRVLNFFTGMPVDDLIEELEAGAGGAPALAGLIARYLAVMAERGGPALAGARCVEASARELARAFTEIAGARGLAVFWRDVYDLGRIMAREAQRLDALGWRRTLARTVEGTRIYRYEESAGGAE